MIGTLIGILLLGGKGLPTSAQILERTQRAYDSVRTFEQDVQGDIGGSKGTAHISFQRPGLLRVAGRSMFGSAYDLLATPRGTWHRSAEPNWSQVQSAEMGIATITGLSANAGMLVPATLMHTKWGSYQALQKTPLPVKAVKLGGQSAYLIQAAKPFPLKIWVDATRYFYLRTEATVIGRKIVVTFDAPKVNAPIPASRFRR